VIDSALWQSVVYHFVANILLYLYFSKFWLHTAL